MRCQPSTEAKPEKGFEIFLRITRRPNLICAPHHSALPKLPKNTVTQVLGKQVLRSGTFVGANYREAFRASSKKEFISKIGDALKEVEETEYWLEGVAR